jgi:hypothetical protein
MEPELQTRRSTPKNWVRSEPGPSMRSGLIVSAGMGQIAAL